MNTASRLAILAAAVFFFHLSADAYPIGPVRPNNHMWSFDLIGAYGRRDMQHQTVHADKSERSLRAGMARATFGLTNEIEVRMGLGGAQLNVLDQADGATSIQTKFIGSKAPMAYLGFGTIFARTKRFDWAFSAGYFLHGAHSGPWPGLASEPNQIGYSEWHAGIQAQANWKRFRPYLGFAYTEARTDYEKIAGERGFGRDEAKHNFGFNTGADLTISDRWSAFGEIRYLDSLAGGAGIRMLLGEMPKK